MNYSNFFQEIKETCKPQKENVVKLCDKLSVKFSLQDPDDVEDLCRLAYWLNTYGDFSPCLQCIALTEDIPYIQYDAGFSEKITEDKDFLIWKSIYQMWGLYMSMNRMWGEPHKAKHRLDIILKHKKLPNNPFFSPKTQAYFKQEHDEVLAFEKNLETPVSAIKSYKNYDFAANIEVNNKRFELLRIMIGEVNAGLVSFNKKESDKVNVLTWKYSHLFQHSPELSEIQAPADNAPVDKDYVMASYSVDYTKRQLVMKNLLVETPVPETTDLIFDGYLTHVFHDELIEAFVYDFDEADINEFLESESKIIKARKANGWPVKYKDTSGLVNYFSTNKYKFFKILIDEDEVFGWVIAQSMSVDVRNISDSNK